MKPLLLTMTQERKEHISYMIRNIYPTFEGIVALVNQPSNDGTFELLQNNKGNGKIIKQSFYPDHSFLMNHLLYYGNIKSNQFCLYLDSPESCTDEFIKEIPNMVEYFNNNNIDALYWDGRPYLFKYNRYSSFFGSVHWGLNGIKGKIITLDNKDKYIINKRKDTPKYYGSLNGTKYYLCYPLGNDVDLVYGKFGNLVRDNHEIIRRQFRDYCIDKIGLNLNNLTDMIKYMKCINDKNIIPDDYFINIVNKEFRLSELFQIEVLGMDLIKDIVPRRYTWSFKNYLKTGDGYSESNFKSDVKIYHEQFNIREG